MQNKAENYDKLIEALQTGDAGEILDLPLPRFHY